MRAVLEVTGEGGALIAAEPGRVVSLQQALRDWLEQCSDEDHALLARVHLSVAEAWASQTTAGKGDLNAAMALYRAAPLAPLTHEWMLAAAEVAGRRGWVGLARRLLVDVSHHTRDPATRERLRQWPAWVAERPAERRSHENGGPEAPWSMLWLRRPPLPLWPAGWADLFPASLVAAIPIEPSRIATAPDGRRLILAGPMAVICFDAQGQWRWTHHASEPSAPPTPAQLRRMVWTPAGSFQPAMDEHTVYTRGGLDGSGQHPTHLLSLALSDGGVRWSTADDPAWRDRIPAGDPVVVDGRLYVLALADTGAEDQVLREIELICLDADTGGIVWRTSLLIDDGGLSVVARIADIKGFQADAAVYGHRVHVRDGAVYCQTNTDVLARVDSRDGRIDWMTRHERIDLDDSNQGLLVRSGAAPVATGEQVLFAPRNTLGVIAVDRATGRRLWEAPLMPSEQMIRLDAERVLLAEGRHLVAIDPATGRPRWTRTFGEAIRGRVQVAGDRAVTVMDGGMATIDLLTGEVIARQEADMAEVTDVACLEGKRLLVAGAGAAGFADDVAEARPSRGDDASVADTGTDTATPTGALARSHPVIWRPASSTGDGSAVAVASIRLLERVELTGEGPRVTWSRVLRDGALGCLWHGDQLILIYPNHVVGVDWQTGRQRWRFSPQGMSIGRWTRFGDHLVLQPSLSSGWYGPMAVVDLARGEPLWERNLQTIFRNIECAAIGFDGDHLQLLTTAFVEGWWHVQSHTAGWQNARLTIDLEHGLMRAMKRYEAPRLSEFTRGSIAIDAHLYVPAAHPPRLIALPLDPDAEPTTFAQAEPPSFRDRGGRIVRHEAPWIVVRASMHNGRVLHTWVYRQDDPAFVRFFESGGQLTDDWFHTWNDQRVLGHLLAEGDGSVPVRYDLAAVPGSPGSNGQAREVIAIMHRQDETWIATNSTGRDQSGSVRIDRFDTRTGDYLQHHSLGGVHGWRSGPGMQVHIHEDAVLVTTPDAVHGFTLQP